MGYGILCSFDGELACTAIGGVGVQSLFSRYGAAPAPLPCYGDKGASGAQPAAECPRGEGQQWLTGAFCAACMARIPLCMHAQTRHGLLQQGP
eukprot:scaffold87064_cov17-Tisochrysis_lutea.AAC.1